MIQFHHTAYVVGDLDSAVTAWQRTMQASIQDGPVVVHADSVKVCFLRYRGGCIELVQPLGDDSPVKCESPQARPHHVCFLCDDLNHRVEHAREDGGVVVRPPVPSEAFGGRRMCFVLYHQIGLIEWIET